MIIVAFDSTWNQKVDIDNSVPLTLLDSCVSITTRLFNVLLFIIQLKITIILIKCKLNFKLYLKN